jgi:uncharacterized membrane protein YkvI
MSTPPDDYSYYCPSSQCPLVGYHINIEQVAGSMIPSLILAANIHPLMAIAFTLLVSVGIYTTAVPLLWTVVVRVTEENTRRFQILTFVLAVIGVIIGLKVPFDRLVNIIYVINGYVGILLLAFMIVKDTGLLKGASYRLAKE